MPDPNEILTALQLHDWYAAAALGLMIVLQVVRMKNIPLLTRLWFKIPDGWRWVPTVALGAATGFTDAFAHGQTLARATLAALGGVLGISFTAMGIHATAKESPLNIDGGAGGKLPVVYDPGEDGNP